MKDFKFPTNIKQIGSISHGVKIYMEDYVVSYLNQYTKVSSEEQMAVLLGKHSIIDEQAVLFISGAIAGKHCEKENGIITLTDKSWDYILAQKEIYFDSLEVVGFALSQPSYGTYLNTNYTNYFMNNFTKPFQVLFIIDPIENVSSFYAHDDQDDLAECTGYFIYYEKNKSMQEYMVQNRTIPKDKKIQESLTAKYKNVTETTEKPATTWTAQKTDTTSTEKMIFNKFPQRPLKTSSEQKKVINLLISLCSVLFILTFVMGMGLLQNGDRISLLENDLKILATSYKNLLASTKETAVFAATNPKTITEKTPLQVDGGNLDEQTKPVNLLDNTKEEPKQEAVVTPPVQNIESSTVPEFYTVEKGDSLMGISQKFYGTKDRAPDIMKINNLDNPNKIIVGQKIKLPKQ